MVRLADGFTPAYAQIRDDFNAAIDKLKATIVSVVNSTGSIETSAKEISVAATISRAAPSSRPPASSRRRRR